MMKDIDLLALDNQICFPLYTASRLVIRLYQPLLKKLDITYPQYLILLVLWEQPEQTVTGIGQRLYLETNTLTPLLKRMESKGLLSRKRSAEDERVVKIRITEKGQELKSEAICIPDAILGQLNREIPGESLQSFKGMLEGLIFEVSAMLEKGDQY